MIEINDQLSIPEHELEFSVSRSAGPGGQHVNKVNTRVSLRFDVRASGVLSDAQKARILRKLATRITKDGVLTMHAQKHRSQSANRRALEERFAEVLREALTRRRPRRATKPTRASKTRRRQEKKRRGDLKKTRGRLRSSEDS